LLIPLCHLLPLCHLQPLLLVPDRREPKLTISHHLYYLQMALQLALLLRS
jgi:hypothetical protein